jgi:hypothetical protein
MVTFKETLELLYFSSGCILAAVGIFALKQIRIARQTLEQTKNNSIISSKRDALRLTAEQCEKFAKDIIPKYRVLKASIKEMDIKFFSLSKVEITKTKITVKPYVDKEDAEKMASIVELLEIGNFIEVFALYYMSQVADETVAYKCLGEVYCKILYYLLPILVSLNTEGEHNAAIDLFILWNNRQESQKLFREKEKIEAAIKSTSTHTFRPLGSE